MLVAQDKRRKNIAEYVLYMWQIEDTLRAFKFDINLIEERIISQFKQSEKVQEDIKDWYVNLILAMQQEGIQEKGHLKIVMGTTDELNQLHLRLINELKEEKYLEAYNKASESIKAFKLKLQQPDMNEIEICFHALYGLLMLRLKKQKVSSETSKAMESFSNLLAHLSAHYKNIEEGKAEF